MGTARRIASLFVLLILISGSLHAQDEYTLSQQGFLTKTGGEPVDSMLSMTFKLYKGGVEVWSETHPSVQVAGGSYDVALGSLTPFDTVTFDVPVELGIKIGTDAEMNPRQPLRASPRALTLQNLRVRRLESVMLGATVNLIGGSELNEIGAADVGAATIGGGGSQYSPNTVSADGGTVGGGLDNHVNGTSGTVGGGFNNVSSGSNSVIGGGQSNLASGGAATVGGGANNTASHDGTVVAGGNTNTASGSNSTVSGGFSNSAASSGAAVGGGSNNSALSLNATVAGGTVNTASATGAFIGAGQQNTASGGRASVLGGSNNVASGDYSAVLSGTESKATGDFSVAAGYKAKALHPGSFVFADNSVTDSLFTTNNFQFLIRATNGVGIGENDPAARLHVTKNNIGVSADDVLNDVILAEDADATIGIYSNPGGTWGSGINLVEMTSCGTPPCAPLPDFENMWSIVRATSGSGNGLSFRYGTNTNYGSNAGKFAVYPNGDASVVGTLSVGGDLSVTGALSKGSGSFKIDHPLDPENKYLYHSFVESPDMMNVYNGNVILNEDGEATVDMPSYFEALNRDFRYQLTPIGAPGPNLYIAEEIKEDSFRIAGGSPGMKVSWLVTGIRKDPYAEMHPIVPEVEKPEAERGTYLHPDAYLDNSIDSR